MKKTVILLKHGNVLLLEPTTDKIFLILKPLLSFVEPKMARGAEAYKLKLKGLSVHSSKTHELFELDHRSRIVTPFGFWKLIRDALRKHGYIVKLQDCAPLDKSKFKLYPNNIKGYKLRKYQPEFLKKVIRSSCGRFDCPPGFGKSFMIGLIAAIYPKAKIDVVTRRVAVLRDRIYPELAQMVGDVGIVGGGKKIKNKRVMCYTAGSLGHSPATADILIGDEIQELSADNSAAQLVRWQNSKNFGLSASHDLRMDGKDLRMHGVFGPIIFKVNYTQAELANMVVPLVVHWTPVVLDYDPCGSREDVEKKRHGFWRNTPRNIKIAEDARRYDDDTQVLITVETIEHAMHLKKQLPEFSLVYMENGLSKRDRAAYAKEGYCSPHEPLMDLDRRRKLTKDFETGKLKKVICTTVWNVGVSFNTLEVLIRADGGGSQINDIQIPGRVSRISDGKKKGVIHDYLDQFNPGYKRRASNRAKSYAKNNWEQVFPVKTVMDDYLGAS